MKSNYIESLKKEIDKLKNKLEVLIEVKSDKEIEKIVQSINKNIRKIESHTEQEQTDDSFYKIIADYTHDWEMFYDKNGRLKYINASFERITGYKQASYISGKITQSDLIHDDYKEITKELFVKAQNGELINDNECKIIHKNGKSIYVSISSQPVLDENNQFIGYRMSIRDINDRKIAENKLKYELELSTILSSLYKPLINYESSIEQTRYLILNYAKQITKSTYGYVGTIDSKTKALHCNTLEEMIKGQCSVTPEKRDIIFQVGNDGKYAALWGHSLNTKKAFYTNQPSSHPTSKGIPAGHILLYNFLSVPVLLGDEVVGQISLANSAEPFTDKDLLSIERIAEYYSLSIQRKRFEEEIKQEEENLKKIFESAPYPLMITALSDSTIFYINQSACDLYGSTKEQLIGQKAIQYQSNPDDSKVLLKLSNEKGLSAGFEVNIQTTNGQEKWVIYSIRKIFYNNIDSLLIAQYDITERRQIEQMLRKNEQKLKELIATKDKFFSIIAHDLKNPFNSMLGFAELLAYNYDDYDNETIKKFINFMYESSKKGYNLLQNLLEWARTQTNQIILKPQKLNVVHFIYNSITLYDSIIKNKNIQIQIDADNSLYCYADSNILDTIIRNIISNAVKYTPENGSIAISAKETTDNDRIFIEYSIKDTGVGISQEDLPKLFRIDIDTKQIGKNLKEKGTGLGLILCKEFIERHGGKIRVESKLDEGSNFIFTIPVSKD